MKTLPQVLFWLGIISVPLAWLMWYFGPEIELVRPVLSGIDDSALRAVLQEAHAERLGIWVGIWPVTLLVLSFIVEKKVQGKKTKRMGWIPPSGRNPTHPEIGLNKGQIADIRKTVEAVEKVVGFGGPVFAGLDGGSVTGRRGGC